MKIVDMIEALGVPWFLDNGDPMLRRCVEPLRLIGDAPGFDADIVFVDGRAMVRCNCFPGPDALHEALHCVLGWESFTCEGVLMVVQRAMIDAATEKDERHELLVDFSNFSLADGEYIGTDGSAFRTHEWRGMESDALRAGFVARRRRRIVPVFGLGVHPSMNEVWLESRCLLEPRHGPANHGDNNQQERQDDG